MTDAAINRRKILRLEGEMAKLGMPGPECPVQHLFAHSSVGRAIILPSGSLVVGQIHKHSHLNFIMRGACIVFTDEGPSQYVGPCYFVSQPGTKRVVHSLTEVEWVTVHVTEGTTEAEIKEDVIAPSFESLGLEVAQGELT